ncbi:MAG TPA: Mu-like prophage major head subunit gpT family protein [Candidatus Obscuribacterales bacterium]
MPPINTSTVVDTLDANLNQIWLDGTSMWPEEYSKVFNVLSSTKQTEKDSYLSGFGAMPEKTEGAAATYDTILPGIAETYTHKTYALGYEITEEAVEDNLYTTETFNKLPKALDKSAMHTVETTAFNVFNNGFSTNGLDGVPLFNTAHPMLDGSTQANRPTTDADLSVTSLTAGLTTIDKYVDERGLKQPTKAVMLLIPVDLWNTAEELIKSEYKPYVANNEVNALQSKDLQYFKSHYLTDTDAFYLLSEKENHMLNFYWRVRLGPLRRGTDFDSTNLKHLARMRFSVGYSHWKGTYGSRGA